MPCSLVHNDAVKYSILWSRQKFRGKETNTMAKAAAKKPAAKKPAAKPAKKAAKGAKKK